MKKAKRIRRLERRVSRLEDMQNLPPVNTLRNRPINTDHMWRDISADYSAAWCGDDDEDYVNVRGYL